MERIIENSVVCRHCGTKIVSSYRHHFVAHVCESAGREVYIAVDGGTSYLRRLGNPGDMIETSIVEGQDE